MEQQLAEVIKNFRVERDWTFQRLSLVTGLSIPTLWHIEAGKTKPNARTLHKLKKAIPAVDEFFRQQQEKTNPK